MFLKTLARAFLTAASLLALALAADFFSYKVRHVFDKGKIDQIIAYSFHFFIIDIVDPEQMVKESDIIGGSKGKITDKGEDKYDKDYLCI